MTRYIVCALLNNSEKILIQIAIIGTGRMGRIHAASFDKVRGCKVTACCDLDLKKSREFAKEFQSWINEIRKDAIIKYYN